MNDLQAFNVELFCESHCLSRAKFYELLKDGLGPDTFRVGRRRLISREAAARWRATMESLSRKVPHG